MATGFAPYLLKHIAAVAKENTPQYKLEPAGYMNLLASQGSAPIVRMGTNQGHYKTVVVKKKQRATVLDVDSTASCDNVLSPGYTEDTVVLDVYRQIAIYYDDETIAKYEEEASKAVASLAGVSIMNEFYDSLMTHASALIQSLDIALLTKQVAAVGTHRATGTTASVTVNFPLDTTNLPLNAGQNKILTDFKKNGGMGKPQIVGSGLYFDYIAQQVAKSADQSGLDTRVQAAGVDFYHDMNAESIAGSNQIIVIQKNAVQLVEYMKYKGFKAGNKGVSTFFTVNLPMQVGSDILPIEFDVQMKYIDCPTELTDAYSGETITTDKGWQIIVSKTCGLTTIPITAYKSPDPLLGNRGTQRYTITNS